MTTTTIVVREITDPEVALDGHGPLRLLVVRPDEPAFLLDMRALRKRVESAHHAQDEPFERDETLHLVRPGQAPQQVRLASQYDGADDNDYVHFRLRVVPLTPGADLVHVPYVIDGRS